MPQFYLVAARQGCMPHHARAAIHARLRPPTIPFIEVSNELTTTPLARRGLSVRSLRLAWRRRCSPLGGRPARGGGSLISSCRRAAGRPARASARARRQIEAAVITAQLFSAAPLLLRSRAVSHVGPDKQRRP